MGNLVPPPTFGPHNRPARRARLGKSEAFRQELCRPTHSCSARVKRHPQDTLLLDVKLSGLQWGSTL